MFDEWHRVRPLMLSLMLASSSAMSVELMGAVWTSAVVSHVFELGRCGTYVTIPEIITQGRDS